MRNRVYEAAGWSWRAASTCRRSKAWRARMRDEVERQAAGSEPEVPAANITLVKPHLAKIKEWIPMAALGL